MADGETHSHSNNPSERKAPIVEAKRPERSTLKERHPDWPEVTVDFLFGPHLQAEDVDQLPELIKGAQIYCYEHLGGPVESQVLNMAAQRPPAQSVEEVNSFIDYVASNFTFPGTESENVYGTFLEGRIRAIYGTGIIVGHFDLDPTRRGDAMIRDDINNSMAEPWFRGGDAEQILADLQNHERRAWEAQHAREELLMNSTDM